ncbi:hypothetical protein ACIGO8_26255 [Streptomyces sp. NPDC053493]|uniref:hypothetical protein n=1 Tax=Streptomyces sp. NPDC053493 TaxID=3365705 RepID=UPI0037D978CB
MRKVLSYAGTVLVPFGAGALLHLWAAWSMRSPVRLPTAVAVLVGLVLAAAALFAHNALFRDGGTGGIVAMLLLVAGLGAVWVEARDSRVRGEVAECVITGKATATYHPTFGEGAPSEKWLYRHPLDCDGGYPTEFKAEERIGDKGKTVRIAYDPAHRMDPVLEKDNVARGSLVFPSVLLALCAAVSALSIVAEDADEEAEFTRRAP